MRRCSTSSSSSSFSIYVSQYVSCAHKRKVATCVFRISIRMRAQNAPSSNTNAGGGSSARTSSSLSKRRRRREGPKRASLSLSFSSSSFRATKKSFSGVSRDDDDDEGRRRRREERAIWRGVKKNNAGSSLRVPPLRAANEEHGHSDVEQRATMSAKNTSKELKAFSSADFGEECVGVGMNAECEIPIIAECDDDDDKSGVGEHRRRL